MGRTDSISKAALHCLTMLGCLLSTMAHGESAACTATSMDTAWHPINEGNLPADVRKAFKATTIANAVSSIGSPYSRKRLDGSETASWLYGSKRKHVQTDCVKPPDITYTTEFYLLSVSRTRNHLSCNIHRRVYMTETPNPDPFTKNGLVDFTVSQSSCSDWLEEFHRQDKTN